MASRPHEILRFPGSDTLIVANGGIQTHPDTGRAKLNIERMLPNLSYLSPLGDVLEMVALTQPKKLHPAYRGAPRWACGHGDAMAGKCGRGATAFGATSHGRAAT